MLRLLVLLLVLGFGSGCAEYGYKMNELVGFNCRPEALQNGKCTTTAKAAKP